MPQPTVERDVGGKAKASAPHRIAKPAVSAVDRSSYKCGKFAPGSRLPIRELEQIRLTNPDFLLILPWNIRDEIVEQMSFIREWGGRFIVPIPHLETF